MKKRKKIILLCSAVFFLAGIGATIPLLVGGEDSSQSSTADTSSTEVSVSMSSPLVESMDSTSTALSAEESEEVSSAELDSEANESSESVESGDSVASSVENPQSDSTMSALNDSSSPDTSSVKELVIGENTLLLIDERAASFTPSTDGQYLFTTSAGARVFYFSTITFRYEELTGALTLTANTEFRLILYAEGEQTVTIHIQMQ